MIYDSRKQVCAHEFSEGKICVTCGAGKAEWTALFGAMDYEEGMYVFEEQYYREKSKIMAECMEGTHKDRSNMCEECKDKLRRPSTVGKCKLCENDSTKTGKMVGIVIKYNNRPIYIKIRESGENKLVGYEEEYIIICPECLYNKKEYIKPVPHNPKWEYGIGKNDKKNS